MPYQSKVMLTGRTWKNYTWIKICKIVDLPVKNWQAKIHVSNNTAGVMHL